MKNKERFPLYVDLDGTLVLNDQVWEATLQFLKKYPYKFFLLFWWLFQGKAIFKENVTKEVCFDPQSLPYNQDLLSFLKVQKEEGVDLYLITGSPQSYAEAVAKFLGLFKEAYGTQGNINLVAKNKLALIQEVLPQGEKFIYIGDSKNDLPVWKDSQEIIAVNPKSSTKAWILKSHKPYFIYDSKISLRKEALKMMRPYQWVKNVLVFVPWLLGGKLFNSSIEIYIITFLALALGCSSVYIVNDLFDIPEDRLHPRKRNRPLASGRVGVSFAIKLAGSLLALSLLLASTVPSLIFLILGYISLTTLYTFKIKHSPLGDVLCLAFLYIYRIIIGCVVGHFYCSNWILGFSFFLFLSLAFLKRYVEIGSTGKARGYQAQDHLLLQISGIASGFISFLIFILYIESPRSHEIFATPALLWFMIPPLLYGHLKCWQAAGQGQVQDDPIIYVFKSKLILTLVTGMTLIFGVAKYVSF